MDKAVKLYEQNSLSFITKMIYQIIVFIIACTHISDLNAKETDSTYKFALIKHNIYFHAVRIMILLEIQFL